MPNPWNHEPNTASSSLPALSLEPCLLLKPPPALSLKPRNNGLLQPWASNEGSNAWGLLQPWASNQGSDGWGLLQLNLKPKIFSLRPPPALSLKPRTHNLLQPWISNQGYEAWGLKFEIQPSNMKAPGSKANLKSQLHQGFRPSTRMQDQQPQASNLKDCSLHLESKSNSLRPPNWRPGACTLTAYGKNAF